MRTTKEANEITKPKLKHALDHVIHAWSALRNADPEFNSQVKDVMSGPYNSLYLHPKLNIIILRNLKSSTIV